VGLQLIGPAFGEERILRVGYAYEQAVEWRKRRPPVGAGSGVGGRGAA